MNVLCNYCCFPSSPNINLISFGKTDSHKIRYDYSSPFPDLVKEVRDKHNIDAVFIYYPEYSAIPPDIQNTDLPIFSFVSDWNLGYFPLRKNLSRFDHIFTDKAGIPILNGLGYNNVSHWNMYGYLPHIPLFKEETPKEWDVVFIGNVNPNVQKERSFFLKRLLQLSDRLKIRIETQIFGDDYLRALKSAKIVFNRSIRGEANMRVFESLALDNLVFLESSNIEIRDYLKPEQECVLYEDNNFEETIEHYVFENKERERIISNASHLSDQYSYTAFLEKLFLQINNLELLKKPRDKRSFCALTQIEQHYENALQATFASGESPSESYAANEFHKTLRNAMPGYMQGLLFRSLYQKARQQQSLHEAEIHLAKRLYEHIKDVIDGQIFNLFNYALLLEETQNHNDALPTLFKLQEILLRHDLPKEAWNGIPAINITDIFYQEINRSFYLNDKRALQNTFSNLIMTRLAILLYKIGLVEKSEWFLEKANSFNKGNFETNHLLGRINLAKKPEKAWFYFKLAYCCNWMHPILWKEFIECGEMLHKKEEAERIILETNRVSHLAKKVYGANF